VENNGALTGAWGNNRVGDGLMVVMINSPEAELSRGMMEVSLRGAVLVSGHVEDPEVLRIANTLPLRGLLISSRVLTWRRWPPGWISLSSCWRALAASRWTTPLSSC
jgi:hypothetical protein